MPDRVIACAGDGHSSHRVADLSRAYVSLLAGGSAYLPGIETLGHSLDLSGSSIPRVVMVSDDVPREPVARLRQQGWHVRFVEPIPNPARAPLFARFRHVFTKLRAWELEDIETVVYLDADTLVLQNVDDLFERPPLAAAPDFLLTDRFNSGVMVLRPCRDTFASMLHMLHTSGSYDGGDQGFLNAFFDWYAMPPAHRLPMGYNTHHFIYELLRIHPLLAREIPEIKIVHYTLQKPWQDRPLPLLAGGANAWWRMYLDGHPDADRRWKRRLRGLQDRPFDWVLNRIVR